MKTWQEIVTERIQGYKIEQTALVEEIHAKISRNDALGVVIRELELVLACDGKESGSAEVGRKLKVVAQKYTPPSTARAAVTMTLEQRVAFVESRMELCGPCTYSQLLLLATMSSSQLASVIKASQRIIKVGSLYQLKGA